MLFPTIHCATTTRRMRQVDLNYNSPTSTSSPVENEKEGLLTARSMCEIDKRVYRRCHVGSRAIFHFLTGFSHLSHRPMQSNSHNQVAQEEVDLR